MAASAPHPSLLAHATSTDGIGHLLTAANDVFNLDAGCRYGGANPSVKSGAMGAKVMGVFNLSADTVVYTIVGQDGNSLGDDPRSYVLSLQPFLLRRCLQLQTCCSRGVGHRIDLLPLPLFRLQVRYH
jgi:hypothetical protein